LGHSAAGSDEEWIHLNYERDLASQSLEETDLVAQLEDRTSKTNLKLSAGEAYSC
jgi:hypothetical protein